MSSSLMSFPLRTISVLQRGHDLFPLLSLSDRQQKRVSIGTHHGIGIHGEHLRTEIVVGLKKQDPNL